MGIVFLAVLGVLCLAVSHVPVWQKLAVDRLLLVLGAVALLLLLTTRSAGRAAGAVRDWLPFAFCILVYENLHDLVPLVHPGLADPTLAAIDRAVLGVDAAVWAQRFVTPTVTRIMDIGYSSYYLLAPLLAGILYLSGERRRFRHVLLGVVLGLYLGYFGYLLVPAIGPRYYQAHLFTVSLTGDVFHSEVIARLVGAHGGTLPRDCFPSLHSALAVTVLGFALRYRRRLAFALLPVVAVLLASTIYLRYHYVVDTAAGIALGSAMVWLGPKVDGAWEALRRRAEAAEPPSGPASSP